MRLIETPDNPAPSGAVATEIRAVDGMRLRVARWHPDGEAIGAVVVCAGRAEFIEKYFETIGELLARRFAVVAFDWRGQGWSGRELDNSFKGHIDDFSLYERDLDAVREQVLEPFCPRPWFGLGHSMGAAILLAQARHARSPFERLALIGPMIGIHGLRFPKASRALTETLDTIGLGGAFVPRGGAANALTLPFEGNPLTSDFARFRRNANIVAAAPTLAVGAPTIGWLNAAFRLMSGFEDPEYPRRILTPSIVFAAGGDRVVDGRAVERFSIRLKAGRYLPIPLARHEILMERDMFRQQFWSGFDAFIPGARDELAAIVAAQASIDKARRSRRWFGRSRA
jgi:lysophospholipase